MSKHIALIWLTLFICSLGSGLVQRKIIFYTFRAKNFNFDWKTTLKLENIEINFSPKGRMRDNSPRAAGNRKGFSENMDKEK